YGDFYVDAENGTDSTTCGGASLALPSLGPCATLNQALANASAGNTIVVVKGGTFGPIYLSGSISIVGPADKSLVIVADGTVNAGCIHTSCSIGTSSGVYIQAAVTDTI